MSQQIASYLTWESQFLLFITLLISIFFPFYIGLTVFLIFFVLLLSFEGIPNLFSDLSTSMRFLWAFALYSFVVSLLGRNSIGVLISIFFPLLLMFFKYYQENVRPPFLENILTITLYTSFFLAIYSGLEYMEVFAEWDYTFISSMMAIDHPGRVEATFFNPNYFATMLEFFVVIGLYKITKEKETRQRLIYTMITLGNIVVVFFTGSRTAPIIIISSLVIFFVMLGHKKIGAHLLILFGLIFLAMIATGNYPRMESVLWALEDRDMIWETAVKGIKDNFLLGQGPLTYLNIYDLYGGKETFHAHNLFLDALLSYGIVGCSLLLYPAIQSVKLMLEMSKHEQLRHQFALYCSLTAVVLIQGITDLGILWFQTSFLFLMITLTAPNLLKEVWSREESGFVRSLLNSRSDWLSV